MGEVPQIFIDEDKVTIICYSRKMVITKGEYDQPMVELYNREPPEDYFLVAKWNLMHDYDYFTLFDMMEECADPVRDEDDEED